MPADAAPDHEKKDNRLSYIDSIRNENTVYSDHVAKSVTRYLENLKDIVTPDSLRLYATEALLNYNWYLIQHRKWFLCERLLHTARIYCPPENQRLSHQINTAIAGVKLYVGDYEEAGNMLQDANDYFLKARDTVEWLKTCVNLGLYYSKIHKKSKALEYYGKVLQTAEKKPYELYYSIVTGYAGNIEEDTIIGLPTFEKALRISLDNGHSFLLASNYNDLAHYYFRMENYHEAMANARKALQYAEKYNLDELKCSVLGIMADIYDTQKNYVSAYRMESAMNDVINSQTDNQGYVMFSNLNTSDSLVNWVLANVPEALQKEGLHQSKNDSSCTKYIWAAVAAVISFLLALLLLYGKRKHSDSRVASDIQPEENTPRMPAMDTAYKQRAENIGNMEKNDDIVRRAAAIGMIAESFNPTLDRIRQMLKEIPKSGDQDVDSRIRNLMSYLLQNRLPEQSDTLSTEIRRDMEEFAARLAATYPTLTKSDIRMASYIRSGIGVQEISAISGLQPKSVNQARYRLRKSLGLGQDDSLESFITAF